MSVLQAMSEFLACVAAVWKLLALSACLEGTSHCCITGYASIALSAY